MNINKDLLLFDLRIQNLPSVRCNRIPSYHFLTCCDVVILHMNLPQRQICDSLVLLLVVTVALCSEIRRCWLSRLMTIMTINEVVSYVITKKNISLNRNKWVTIWYACTVNTYRRFISAWQGFCCTLQASFYHAYVIYTPVASKWLFCSQPTQSPVYRLEKRRVANSFEAEPPSSDWFSVSAEENPRSKVPLNIARINFLYCFPYRVGLGTVGFYFCHDRAAVVAIGGQTISSNECWDLAAW